ncbi:MAG: hypothetical protein LBT46_15395 [Planctomycetaceae bacterium]|jgi:hypothetical protein|nr:hypothetical protein [Planctomycetaceae bacterium]
MDSGTKFKPVLTTEAKLISTPVEAGAVYFCTDTLTLWVDTSDLVRVEWRNEEGTPGLSGIQQAAWVDMPLQTPMDSSANLDTAAYFACDTTSVWKFADVTAIFSVESIDSASRIIGNGESIKIYYESVQYGEITANNGTYTFAGPVLFRGLDGYIGDISGITITQDAISSGLEDLAATAANAVGWLTRQLDALKANTAGHVRTVSLGYPAYVLPTELGNVDIPRASAAILVTDPDDYGTAVTVAELPPCPQTHLTRYVGVTDEGSQLPATTKFVPVYDPLLEGVVADPQCVLKDAPVNPNLVFTRLHLPNTTLTAAQRTGWIAESGWTDAIDMPIICLQRAEVIANAVYDTVMISGSFRKGLALSLNATNDYVGLFSSSGTYAGSTWSTDLSTEPDWQTGDTLHYDAATGDIWVTDTNGDVVDLRIAVSVGNPVPLNNWSYTLSWLHYIGGYFINGHAGGYAWQDANALYVSGAQVQGTDTRGYLHPQDFANFADKYTKAEADVLMQSIASSAAEARITVTNMIAGTTDHNVRLLICTPEQYAVLTPQTKAQYHLIHTAET